MVHHKIAESRWLIAKKKHMDGGSHHITHVAPLKTFILEDRELFRLLLMRWLGQDGGHQVIFFDSAEVMKTQTEVRRLELMASHLLPGRNHFRGEAGQHPHAVYGENMDAATVHWCRKNGVRGLLDLRDRAADWKKCLEAVGNGHTSETPSVSRILANGEGGGIASLSRRENEVARLLVKGLSAKQVAASLGTSEGTVKNQRKSVYRKLGIIRATQLAGAMGYAKTR